MFNVLGIVLSLYILIYDMYYYFIWFDNIKVLVIYMMLFREVVYLFINIRIFLCLKIIDIIKY